MEVSPAHEYGTVDDLIKRVLFVEDVGPLSDAYRQRLRQRPGMQIAFACGTDDALAKMHDGNFDVVITGLNSARGNSASLLQIMKDRYPAVVRMIMAGNADREAILPAVSVSHQFISNPNTEYLFNAIDRACRLRSLLADESLRKSIGNIGSLPSVPALYHELVSAMSKPNVSSKVIASIIEQDPAMAAKILQLVNSACFASSKQITRIDHAVVYLGMDLIRNLALSAHVFSAFRVRLYGARLSFEKEQRHALLVAKVASRMFRESQESQDALTAGLLHDVGTLILAVSMPKAIAAVLQTEKLSHQPRCQIELEKLGITHAQAGAYLLGLWGLPYPIVEAVAYHHMPAAAGERVFGITTAVSVADHLVDRQLGLRTEIDKEHLAKLGMLDKLKEWADIVREEVEVSKAAGRTEGSSASVR